MLRGSATARLAIAGQAPGTRVHKSGTPFTDPSGDRLRAWMGVTSEEFYDESRIAILPMGFCFPGLDAKGGDLPPRPECAPAWRRKVLAGMPDIEVVLAVGQYAHWWHLPGPRMPVTQTVRRFSELLAQPIDADRPLCLPLPHPSWRNNAWIKANPWFAADVLPALQRIVRDLITGPEKNYSR
ncbi:MAG: uracil-DNA glycosylase family protein [Hyphomicrobiaceae bacterium]